MDQFTTECTEVQFEILWDTIFPRRCLLNLGQGCEWIQCGGHGFCKEKEGPKRIGRWLKRSTDSDGRQHATTPRLETNLVSPQPRLALLLTHSSSSRPSL